MNNRITLVSLFDSKNLNKVKQFTDIIKEPLCKVPFGKKVESRIESDTLPYHFTLCAWNIENEENVIKQFSTLSFRNFKILVDGISIMNGKENSYVLYFNIKDNNELSNLLEKVYKVLPSEKYNPKNFKFHITITIDQDYEKILRIKNTLEQTFMPFELEVNEFGLFEIYPAELVKVFKTSEE